jgi:DNA mismatch repair protein MutS
MYSKIPSKVLAISALLSISLYGIEPETAPKADESAYVHVGNLVLQTEDQVTKPITSTGIEKKEEKNHKEKLEEMLKPLESIHKKQITFNLLAQHGKLKQTTRIMEPYVLHELNVILGSEKSKKITLFAHLNKTQTTVGSAVLARMLSEPKTDKTLLTQRQHMIQMLMDNKRLFEELQKAFETIGKNEDMFLSFWNPDRQLSKEIEQFAYFPGSLSFLNSKPGVLEFRRSSSLAIGCLSPLIFYGYTGLIAYRLYRLGGSQPALIVGGLMGGIYTYVIVQLYQQLRLLNFLFDTLQRKMHSVREVTASLEQIHKAVTHHPEFVAGIESFAKLGEFVEAPYKLSPKLDQLKQLLEAPVFKGEPRLFSYMGKVAVAYKLMQEAKDEFISALEAAGEIEAYVAVAQVVQEYKNKRVNYCFTEFVENATPYIELTNVWNPLIDSNQVVTESVTFGKPEYAHNIMLTGPHGGGKSTFMKSVAYSIILSQTFGITPALKARMTLFQRLNSYVNIKEDLATGQSTFMAEVKRAQEIREVLTKLKPEELSFTVMDEVFKGTMQEEGALRLKRFGNDIAHIPQSMCIIATHYKEPAQLEEETNGEFTNYHAGLIELEDHTFHRTFKLVKGKNEWWFNDAEKRGRYIDWLTTIL